MKRNGSMLKIFRFWPIVRSAGLSLLLGLAEAAAQSQTPYSIALVPTGQQPMGIAITTQSVSGVLGSASRGYAMIANFGDNSVSIFGPLGTRNAATGEFTLPQSSVITGIPSPYAISTCPIDNNLNAAVLVTSPSTNSVRLFSGTAVPTGSQPYAVICTGGLGGAAGKGVVSNVGDNSLTVFDVATLKVTATIPGVPGSRAFHGIAVSITPGTPSQNTVLAWVAGTDANVVTVVDLVQSTVVTQIPISSPTAVLTNGALNIIYVASAGAGTVTAYDASTLSQVNNQFATVPNPGDVIFSPLIGDFAISGPDTLWKFDPLNSAITGAAASIPGGAALAAPYFSPDEGVAACCAMVLATNPGANSVYLIQPPPATPTQFAIQNGGSFAATGAAPGSLVSAVKVATGLTQNVSATTMPLPTMLGGVAMNIGGSLTFDTPSNTWVYSPAGSIQAPLLFVGPNQINFQIPPGIGLGSAVPVQLTTPDGSTLLTTLNVTATSPGIFTLSSNGQGQGAVLNFDSSLNGIPQIIAGASSAQRGSVIQIFATGAGATNPPLAPGDAAPSSGNPLVFTIVQPTVTIGGTNAPVQFSGMAPGYPGVWQIKRTSAPKRCAWKCSPVGRQSRKRFQQYGYDCSQLGIEDTSYCAVLVGTGLLDA